MTRIRIVLLTALMVCSLSFGLAKADGAAIRDVIAAQIDAFQRNDLPDAFSHASPAIKQLFQTPERFGAMVQSGYPMVWRPSAMRFGVLSERRGRQVQSVLFEDAAGVSHLAEYEMIDIDGVWQINGVRILPAPGAGA